MGQLIEVPRVNANEDHLQVIDIRVVEGQQVEQGDILLVLETTKAAVEVEAPQTGTIRGLQAQVGEFVDVGAVLCRIADATEDGEAGISAFAEVDAKEIVVTAKARKVAAEIGIDLAQVSPANGRIGEAEVRAAAAGLARTAVNVAWRALLSRLKTRRDHRRRRSCRLPDRCAWRLWIRHRRLHGSGPACWPFRLRRSFGYRQGGASGVPALGGYAATPSLGLAVRNRMIRGA